MGDLSLKGATSGQITLTPTAVAGTNTLTLPAVTGTVSVQSAASFTQGSVIFAGSSGVFSQNNSQLFWDNTNNYLGIGTTSPASALCLGNVKTLSWLNASNAYNGTTTGAQILKFSDNNLYIDNLDASTNIIFRRNGPTESMRIDSSGNVGIGTASPSSIGKFVVQGTSGTTQGWIGSSAGNGVLVAAYDSGTIYQLAASTNSTAYAVGTQTTIPLSYLTNNTERARIDASGNLLVGTTTANASLLTVAGPIALNAPTTKTSAYSMTATDSSLIFQGTASITLTLQAASSYPGRILYVKNIAAFTVVSASSNVVPRTSATAGTAILAATAGSWAMLQSDGTNWVIMAGA